MSNRKKTRERRLAQTIRNGSQYQKDRAGDEMREIADREVNALFADVPVAQQKESTV